LSWTTCVNDESLKQEENISSTANTLSRLSPIEDIAIKTSIIDKVNFIVESRDNNQTIIMSER
jgi:hypothetical protein